MLNACQVGMIGCPRYREEILYGFTEWVFVCQEEWYHGSRRLSSLPVMEADEAFFIPIFIALFYYIYIGAVK